MFGPISLSLLSREVGVVALAPFWDFGPLESSIRAPRMTEKIVATLVGVYFDMSTRSFCAYLGISRPLGTLISWPVGGLFTAVALFGRLKGKPKESENFVNLFGIATASLFFSKMGVFVVSSLFKMVVLKES